MKKKLKASSKTAALAIRLPSQAKGPPQVLHSDAPLGGLQPCPHDGVNDVPRLAGHLAPRKAASGAKRWVESLDFPKASHLNMGFFPTMAWKQGGSLEISPPNQKLINILPLERIAAFGEKPKGDMARKEIPRRGPGKERSSSPERDPSPLGLGCPLKSPRKHLDN